MLSVLEQRLEELRKEYVTATEQRRAIIIVMAKVLESGIKGNYPPFVPTYHKEFIMPKTRSQEVSDALF